MDHDPFHFLLQLMNLWIIYQRHYLSLTETHYYAISFQDPNDLNSIILPIVIFYQYQSIHSIH